MCKLSHAVCSRGHIMLGETQSCKDKLVTYSTSKGQAKWYPKTKFEYVFRDPAPSSMKPAVMREHMQAKEMRLPFKVSCYVDARYWEVMMERHEEDQIRCEDCEPAIDEIARRIKRMNEPVWDDEAALQSIIDGYPDDESDKLSDAPRD